MSAAVLLEELRQLVATVAVVDGRLRVEAPRGRVTPELRESLSRHKDELRALLERTLPEPGPHRLGLAECVALLDAMHAEIRAAYVDGALALLDADPDLAGRLRATEARLDELARMPGGPVEADFRVAVEAHAALWREIIARARARCEQQADPMPELPADAVAAVGISYGDGRPGTWDVVRRGR